MGSRKTEHGDSWRRMTMEGLLYGAFYKIDRARTNRENLTKKLDDVLDAINYLKFYAVRLLELMKNDR